MKNINTFITERQMGGEWKTVKDNNFKCIFLAFDEPSEQYGIDGGKISKLSIKDLKSNKQIVNYDRGWDEEVDQNNKELIKFYNKIIKEYN